MGIRLPRQGDTISYTMGLCGVQEIYDENLRIPRRRRLSGSTKTRVVDFLHSSKASR